MRYAAYDRVEFNEVVRTEGDSFARYMIRMDEIRAVHAENYSAFGARKMHVMLNRPVAR